MKQAARTGEEFALAIGSPMSWRADEVYRSRAHLLTRTLPISAEDESRTHPMTQAKVRSRQELMTNRYDVCVIVIVDQHNAIWRGFSGGAECDSAIIVMSKANTYMSAEILQMEAAITRGVEGSSLEESCFPFEPEINLQLCLG